MFDIDLPHINQPLWTSEQCRQILAQSGFNNIKIKIERSSEYITNSDYFLAWDGQDFYPRGNPLDNLSRTESDKLQTEYQKLVQHYITDKGIWLDTSHMYVRACK